MGTCPNCGSKSYKVHNVPKDASPFRMNSPYKHKYCKNCAYGAVGMGLV